MIGTLVRKASLVNQYWQPSWFVVYRFAVLVVHEQEHICCVLQTLQRTLTTLHANGEEHYFYQPVHTYVLNPKAVTMEELYGGVNKITLEWRDGLMATCVRHAVKVCVRMYT